MSDVEQLAANIRALTGRLAAAERERDELRTQVAEKALEVAAVRTRADAAMSQLGRAEVAIAEATGLLRAWWRGWENRTYETCGGSPAVLDDATGKPSCEGCFVERNPIGGHGRGHSRGEAK